MKIQLSGGRETFVRSLVKGGRYASEAEVVEEALLLLEARDASLAKQRLESLLLEGMDSGPSTPMTSGDWAEIEREGQRLIEGRRDRDGR